MRDRLCVPFFFGVLDFEELHMLNRGHWIGHPWLKLRKTKCSA